MLVDELIVHEMHIKSHTGVSGTFSPNNHYLGLLAANSHLQICSASLKPGQRPKLQALKLPVAVAKHCKRFAFQPAFNPDLPVREVAVATGGKVVRFSLAEGQEVAAYDFPAVSLAYSQRGTLLAAGTADGLLRIWHTRDGKNWKSIMRDICNRAITAMAFDSKDNLVVCDASGLSFRLTGISDRRPIRCNPVHEHRQREYGLPEGWEVYDVAFRPGSRVAVFAGVGRTASVVNFKDGSITPLRTNIEKFIRRVEFADAGRLLLYGQGLEVWGFDFPFAQRQLVWQPEHGRSIVACRYQEGQLVAITANTLGA